VFEFLLQSHLPDRTLILYRAGLLNKDRYDMLEAHLVLCPTCQLQLEGLCSPRVSRHLRISAWAYASL
jgi:hypothetical protein